MSISLLSRSVIALMAAGEVIHRPADIVKELVENALDSGADSIRVDLMQGGIEKIKVTDNGCGISAGEIRDAIEPHATSKLSQIEDLQSISTYGFRGEALYSISNVCNFILTSKTEDQDLAEQLSICSPDRKLQRTKVPMATGTFVQANQLFAPYPVRRKFLKSPRLEFQKSLVPVLSLAIAHHNTDFVLTHNGRGELNLSKTSSQKERLEQIFRNTRHSWRHMQRKFDKGSIDLWFSPRSTKGVEQWWFINKRAITDPSLKKLCSQYVSVGKLVFNLTIDSQYIDPNLHPQKSVVGLSFYEAFVATLQDFLNEHFELSQEQVERDRSFEPDSESAHPESEPRSCQNNRSFAKQLDFVQQDNLSGSLQSKAAPGLDTVAKRANKEVTSSDLRHPRSISEHQVQQSLSYLQVNEKVVLVKLIDKIYLVNIQDFISIWLKKFSSVKPLLIPFPISDQSLQKYLVEHGFKMRQNLLTHMSLDIDCVKLEQMSSQFQSGAHEIVWLKILKESFWAHWSEQDFLDFIVSHNIQSQPCQLEFSES